MSFEMSVARYATAMTVDAGNHPRLKARRVYVSLHFAFDSHEAARNSKPVHSLLDETCAMLSSTIFVSSKSPAADDFCSFAQYITDVIVPNDVTPNGISAAVKSEIETFISAEGYEHLTIIGVTLQFERG